MKKTSGIKEKLVAEKSALKKKIKEPKKTVFQCKNMDDKLPDADERLRGIVENTQAGYFYIDSAGCFRHVNSAWLRMHGYDSPDEIIGRHFSITQVEDDKEKANEIVEALLAGKSIQTIEFSRRCKDSSIGYHTFSASPVIHKGEVVGLEGFIIDTTQHKRMETVLQKINDQQRFALETSHIGAWDLDLVDHSAFRSLEHDRIFGYADLLPEWTYEMFLEHVLPEDREMVDYKFQEATKNQSDWSFECRIRRVDGEVRWIWAAGRHQTDSAGKASRMSGIVQDITSRRLMEEQEKLTRDVLEVINNSDEVTGMVRSILSLVKSSTGIEAVGIRLREGDDYPYFETSGFPDYFVELENSLCERDDEGNVLRDKAGNPVLECMCGNILRGRTNPQFSFFTEGGSFWSNCTTKLLASTTDADRQARTRNRCNGEGYESVALIPLRSGREIIGLLQLNDHRKNRFTLELIRSLENLGNSIGLAISRKEAVLALRESEERYRTVADFTYDWEYWADPSGNLLYVSPSCERITGYQACEFQADPGLLVSIVHPDDREKFADHLQHTKLEGVHETDFRIIARDSSLRWIGHRCQPVYSQDGRWLGRRASNRDITARKQVLDELRESEGKYRLLADHMKDIVWLMDMNLKTTFVSPSGGKIRGYTLDEIQQLPLERNLTPASFQLAMKVFAEELPKIMADPAYYISRTLELEFYRKDGTTFWSECRFSLIRDEQGNPESILGEGRDITDRKLAEEARKKSEEKFSKAFMVSPEAITITSVEGGLYVEVNDVFLTKTGFQRDEVIGHTSDDSGVWVGKKDRQSFVEELSRNGFIKNFELQFRMRNGEIRDFLVSSEIIELEGKKCILNFIIDITDRKQAEEALIKAQALTTAIVDSTTDLIWSVDSQNFGLLTFNRALYDYFLSQRNINIKPGMRPEDLFPTDDFIQQWKGFYQRALAEGSYATEYDVFAGTKKLQLTLNLLRRDGDVFGISVFGKDITEQKKADTALRESEAKFRAVVENSIDGILFGDAEANIHYRSPSYSKINGFTDEERIGHSGFETVHPEDTESLRRYWTRLLAHPEISHSAEYRILHKDGTWRWVESTGQNLLSNPDVRSVIVTSRDISDRKQAEQALKESELRYRQLFETIPESVLLIGPDRCVVAANRASASLYGYESPQQLEGFDTRLLIAKRDRERAAQIQANALQGEEQPAREYIEVRRDGSEFVAEVISTTLHGLQQELLGYIGITRDITANKEAQQALLESEERYRTYIESAPNGVFIADEKGCYVQVNPAAGKITGYSRDELLNMSVGDLSAPESRETAIQNFHKVVNTGYSQSESSFCRKNGEIRYWSVDAVKISETRFMAYVQDITDRKQALEEKQLLEERLQRAEKMEALGLLAGGVAHDLNNVLGIVIGYSGMIMDDIDEKSPIRESLLNIMDGGQRAAAIVQDLLTMARRGVSGRKVINLNRLVLDYQKSAEWEKLSSLHPSVRIKADLEADLLNVSASAVHMEKALFNLVSNAAEAMPQGGTLTIKTANQYLDKPVHGYDEIREGDYVVLSVTDTGEGIAESDLQRIFEPFYTKKIMGRSGTGLGLAIVWGTVKDHQGYIDLQSQEGKGSTFTIYFPVTREEIKAESSAISISEYMGKGEKILVVDDISGQRNLATAMLTKLNYKVESVESGEEAVEYLKNNKVDLLVLDMIMDRGMDGLDTYKSVLAIHPNQKAIIVSGFSETDRVSAAQALGAGAYVKKPYVIEKLGMAVKKELEEK